MLEIRPRRTPDEAFDLLRTALRICRLDVAAELGAHPLGHRLGTVPTDAPSPYQETTRRCGAGALPINEVQR